MDPLIRLFQQLRYGERTARGTAGGKRVRWVLAPEERRRARNNKNFMLNCDMRQDMVLLDHREYQLLVGGEKREQKCWPLVEWCGTMTAELS